MITRADWIIDMGPGPGRHGGRIIYSGLLSGLLQADTATAAVLQGWVTADR